MNTVSNVAPTSGTVATQALAREAELGQSVMAEAERINQFRRAHVLGRNVWELFPAVVGTTLETQFRRAVAEQVTAEFENRCEPWGRWYALKACPASDGGQQEQRNEDDGHPAWRSSAA